MQEQNIHDEEYSKKVLISLLFLTLLVILVISLSLALFARQQKESTPKENRVSKISMNYTEDTNGISIVNASPITDEVGMKLSNENEYFDFSVNASIEGDMTVQYEITAVKDSTSTIPDSDIKLYLEEQRNGTYIKSIEPTNFIPMSKYSSIGSPKGSMILKTVTQNKSGTKNYRLRMWVDHESNLEANKTYSVKINVYGKQIEGE